eukprot:TRINITY_DN34999_c0_g1_i1.p2 TRINITY_DN34999_c0_g1~~TRINITY_DN34999_c0_g1_i1.p2  ORF type:complete len:110 (+),score=2.84 TRINITY_DN34999_c0_g1_i1:235-564(+)
MVCSTTSDDLNVTDIFNLLFSHVQLRQLNFFAFIVDATKHCITICFWLLMNFFEHEVLESAFFCGYSIPIDMNHFPRNKIALNRHQFDSIMCQYSHLTIVQDIHVTCML